MKPYLIAEILCLFFYILVIILILREEQAVTNDPKKYNRIPGYERYCASRYYKPPKWVYNKLEVPRSPALLLLSLPQLAILLLIGMEGSRPFIGKCVISVFTDGNLGTFEIGSLLMLLAIMILPVTAAQVMLFLLPFPSCASEVRAIQAAANGTVSRAKAYKNALLLFLAAFVICVPILFLSVFNYYYMDEEKLVVNPYFGITEETFRYDEISDIENEYDSDGTISSYVICNEHGHKFDILNLAQNEPKTEELPVAYIIEHIDQ